MSICMSLYSILKDDHSILFDDIVYIINNTTTHATMQGLAVSSPSNGALYGEKGTGVVYQYQ